MRYRFRNCLLAAAGLFVPFSAMAADYVWLVAGSGGTAEYTSEFDASLHSIQLSLTGRHHYQPDKVQLLSKRPEGLEGATAYDEITLAEFQEKWAELIKTIEPSDTFLLILMGHGQSDFVDPKFNLKGPDLKGKTLAAMFEALPCEEKRAILSFPCSGHFSEFLAPVKDLSVIASTDGPRQIYRSVMNLFLVQAFQDEWSDQDGDGALTFYELFQFLSNEVDDYYESQDFEQIANVSLEDNGDGRVTTFAADMDAGDGDRAREQRVWPAPGYVEQAEESVGAIEPEEKAL